MSTAKWSTPTAISASLVTTELDGLANAAECVVFTYDNSSNLDLYGAVTVKLGSIAAPAGSSISLRVLSSDGTNTPDKAGGDTYTQPLLVSTSAKIVVFPMVRLYPFSLRFSIINNSTVTFNAADNDVYIRPYNESIV